MSRCLPILPAIIAGAVLALPLVSGVPGTTLPNLARGRAITPVTNTIYGAPEAVTNGVNDVWYSYQTGEGGAIINVFVLDLGATYSIGKINFTPAQTAAFTIWSSTDGTNYTQRHDANWTTATGVPYPFISAPATIQVNGAYSARYIKYEGRAWWNQYVGMNEFEVYEWQGGGPAEPNLSTLTNLALGKPAANGGSPYTNTTGHGPELLTDGNLATYWQGDYSQDQCVTGATSCGLWYNTSGHVKIDLGAASNIQAIRVRFPAGAPGIQSLYATITDGGDAWSPEDWFGFYGHPTMTASNPVQTSSDTLTFYLPAPVNGRYVWLLTGTWITATPVAPAISEVEVFGALPVSGTPAVGLASPSAGNTASQSFTFTFTDPQGWQDLDVVNILVNNFLDGRYACYLAYSRPLNVLYLVNDPGTALLPGLLMNGAGTLGNSQCSILGAGSSAVGSGNTLTLTLNMTFPTAFAGNRIFYAAARDLAANNSGWKGVGTWNIPGAAPAQLVAQGVAPAQGTGSSQTFAFTFTNTLGASNFGVLNILINDALDGRYACYLAYARPINVLYLVNDPGTALLPGLLLNGSGTLANSQCSVNGAGASVTASGNTLTITLPITFPSGFKGNRILYLAARDVSENNSGWHAKGTWLIP